MSKIVVIEDNVLVARIYETKLKKEGHSVGLAFDGEAGLLMVRTSKPDLILVDLNLPLLSGVEIIKRLRADAEFRDLAIIAYSADANLLRDVEPYRPTQTISKTELSPKEIVETVKDALQTSQTWDIFEPNPLTKDLVPATESTKAQTNSASLLNLQKVLIADDDPTIALIVREVVEGLGYEAVIAADGREAYQTLSQDANFIAAVFDVEMPYIKGPDLIKHMRTEKRLANIPVMIMTAEQSIKVQLESFNAGAIMFLPKPFTRKTLENVFKAMVNAG